MNIAILVDKFSGHLFHDVELFIVLFEKRYENIACIQFSSTSFVPLITFQSGFLYIRPMLSPRLLMKKFIDSGFFGLKCLYLINEMMPAYGNLDIIALNSFSLSIAASDP